MIRRLSWREYRNHLAALRQQSVHASAPRPCRGPLQVWGPCASCGQTGSARHAPRGLGRIFCANCCPIHSSTNTMDSSAATSGAPVIPAEEKLCQVKAM
jgi:hypothetical protein